MSLAQNILTFFGVDSIDKLCGYAATHEDAFICKKDDVVYKDTSLERYRNYGYDWDVAPGAQVLELAANYKKEHANIGTLNEVARFVIDNKLEHPQKFGKF